MPSGLFLSCSNILSCTIPFPAGRQAGSVFPLLGAHHHHPKRLSSTFSFLGSFWSYLVFTSSIIICCVFFLNLFISHNFPLCFRIRSIFLFFFFREEQQQVFLRFNVTPSANFLVCSKCVTGDSQQDRNARAYFLVKQENKQKTATE